MHGSIFCTRGTTIISIRTVIFPDDMYEFQNDAAQLKYWFTPKAVYKLKCPEPTPIQEVEFSAASMLPDVYQAGAPAGISDGS
eukprot:9354300-Pyramimonas_sp.AAC.1